MRIPPYILSRPSGYYFRFVVPRDLRQRVGKSEIRKSLRTRDLREALLKAARMSATVLQQIKVCRKNMANFPDIDFGNIRTFEIESLEIGGTTLKGINVDSSNPLDVAAFTRVLDALRASNAAEAESAVVSPAKVSISVQFFPGISVQ